MSVNATIDGTQYNDINTITVGGKNIMLVGEGGELPSGIAEIKVGEFSSENEVSSEYSFNHGCSSTPDIVIINSNYTQRYSSDVPPAHTTIVGSFWDSASKVKSYAAITTTYTTGSEPTSCYAVKLSSTDVGFISNVDETKVYINAASTKRIGAGLTYKYIAIVLSQGE